MAEFEQAVAAFVGAREAVAVSSGTAALHAAMFAADIGPGDEVIVPAMTFVATANAVVFQGGTPVFADVNAGTLLMDVQDAERKITPRTKAIITMDYAGQPCDYKAFRGSGPPPVTCSSSTTPAMPWAQNTKGKNWEAWPISRSSASIPPSTSPRAKGG